MLIQLTIENFAIIDRVDLRLGPGLVVLTGETGAGKSIVVDAVGGLLGNRLGAEVVRAGASQARVEGIFLPPREGELPALLDELGLATEDDTLIISREIAPSGRSVARVNGRAVTLATLQRIGRTLMDLHGQGDHLTLLRVPEHLRLLDGFAGLTAQREKARQLAEEIHRIRAERAAYTRDQREIARRLDLLRFQIKEIDDARLEAGEEERLRQERTILANAEKLTQGIDAIYAALSEGEDGSALDRLGVASAQLADLARLDPTLADDRHALDELIDQVGDLARRLRRYRERLEFDPERLEEIEDRLNLIRNLERKYGSTVADVLSFAETARAELDGLEHREERVADLAERERDARERFAVVALALSEARRAAATRLAAAVERELAELNMAGARFQVAIVQEDDPEGVALPDGRTVAFSGTGIDRVEFYIAPNVGEDFKPLVRVVSGGETARLMLALKHILSQADTVPTLIFDEVDAGIGGQTAVVVGRKIATLARERQVICVTHLSQIAAFADVHVAVRKTTADGRTRTEVRVLDRDSRVVELAAMIGGEAGMASARAHAQDALRASDAWKAERVPAERGAR